MADLLTLDEMEPYILGKKFNGNTTLNKDAGVLEEFKKRLSESPTAMELITLVDSWQDFYKSEPDFKEWIKVEHRAEVFYAVKNGEYSLLVPSVCIFLLRKAYEKYKSPNMIFKQIPSPVFDKFTANGYLGGGLNLQDVVCSFCTPNYKPLSKTCLKNKCGTFTEIYVQSTDMVALVPNRLADMLDDDSIDRIVQAPGGLSIGGTLLSHMCGYHGAINSTYDLRELI